MSINLITRLVRGVISQEERQLAYMTSATDPVGEMPTGPKVMTTRMMQLENGPDAGTFLPAYSPGYMQKKLESKEVVDEADIIWLKVLSDEETLLLFPERDVTRWGRATLLGPSGTYYGAWEDASGSYVGLGILEKD